MIKEIWKDISGYEGLYQVSNFGRIKSYHRGKTSVLAGTPNNGYIRIRLCKDGIRGNLILIHRLVCVAFIPNPENKPCVNHIDGNPSNNNVNNLEWCTSSENELHSHRVLKKPTTKYWLGKKGKLHYWSKPIICIQTNKRYDCAKEAAHELNLQGANICKVLNGQRNHTGGYTFKYA